MRKEKEYVVIYLDCCLYGCDVADDQRIVINLTRNGLFYHDRIITCQITEVIHLLCNNYGGISRFDLLDFECLDLQIRQSVEYCEDRMSAGLHMKWFCIILVGNCRCDPRNNMKKHLDL